MPMGGAIAPPAPPLATLLIAGRSPLVTPLEMKPHLAPLVGPLAVLLIYYRENTKKST